MVFYDTKGLVYFHGVSRGITINANYTLVVLDKCLMHLKKKWPKIVNGDRFSTGTTRLFILPPLSKTDRQTDLGAATFCLLTCS
jgi:hypothetical protein